MKNSLLIILMLTIVILGKAQHIETTIKIVNDKARITVKSVGGTIKGQVSNVIFAVAIPINTSVTLDYPTILDASRLPVTLVKSSEDFSDGKYKYFNLCFIYANRPATYAEGTEYELLELNWKGNGNQDFPVTLISLENNPKKLDTPFGIINYFEIGGKQYSTGDHLFYQSSTSGLPVQMAADYSSGTASVTAGKLCSGDIIVADKPKTFTIGSLFPNPAKTQVNIIIDAPERDDVTLLVTDIMGKTVKQQLVNVEIGSNTVPVDISNLAQGSYLVKAVCKSSDCGMAVGKFNKQL